MHVYIEGIGLSGPGLDGWAASLPVLAGVQDYVRAPIRVAPSTLLPANERRRAVRTVRIALVVGAEAFAAAGRDPAETATVFASSGGDGETIHEILSALALPNRELSPTKFHNSVHNAPAGYWSIATGSRAASSSLCCHDDSFAAGLLEATVRTAIEQQAVALLAYDVPYPAPLGDARSIETAFAVALVLSPVPTQAAIARLEIDLQSGSGASVLASPGLEGLRCGTPAARSLTLLAALARNIEAACTLNYLNDMVLMAKVIPMQHDVAIDAKHSAQGAG